jgi:hypothetical protein
LLRLFNDYIKKQGNEKNSINHRYQARHQIYEILEPILSGKLFREFDEDQGYINFSQYMLMDNFNGGHAEYLHKWKHLFLYETYSFLMNSRWTKFTGGDLEMKQALK